MEWRLIVALLCISSFCLINAQRGCNVKACDPRGLHTQADFVISLDAKPSVAWRIPIGPLQTNRSTGCLGNWKNVLCPNETTSSSGYVSVDVDNGTILYTDNLMKKPGLPIMNINGDYIAADGYHMEFREVNGSILPPVDKFYGDWVAPVSSILYVEEPNLYFFMSHNDGGLFLYDTSGMCVASYFITKVPNHYDEVWIPVSEPVVNTELDPRSIYFIAQDNLTHDYRLYGMNIAHQPPYIRIKWFYDLTEFSGVKVNLSQSPLLSVSNYIYIGMNNKLYIFQDLETRVEHAKTISLPVSSLSSFDTPVDLYGSFYQHRDDVHREVWVAYEDKLLGIAHDTQETIHSIDLSQLTGMTVAGITSNIMLFGTSPDDIVIVVAVPVRNTDTSSTKLALLAIKPHLIASADMLWSIDLIDTQACILRQGQIIGYQDNTLVIQSTSPDCDGEMIAVRLQ